MKEDLRAFVNRIGGYRGSFSIELIEGVKTDHVPNSAKISGNIVTVQNGSVTQTIFGIEFHSELVAFAFYYNSIKCIRKGDGSLYWVNNHLYRN